MHRRSSQLSLGRPQAQCAHLLTPASIRHLLILTAVMDSTAIHGQEEIHRLLGSPGNLCGHGNLCSKYREISTVVSHCRTKSISKLVCAHEATERQCNRHPHSQGTGPPVQVPGADCVVCYRSSSSCGVVCREPCLDRLEGKGGVIHELGSREPQMEVSAGAEPAAGRAAGGGAAAG
jgi:hypothetical protein